MEYFFNSYMEGPGTMTWEEFLKDAEAIVCMSNEICDHWQLVGDKEVPGNAYLARQVKTYVPCEDPTNDLPKGKDEEWYERLHAKVVKDPFEAHGEAERPLVTHHHVLWCMSYNVPVLYFNGWKSDFPGANPVSVETVQKLVPYGGLGYSELSQAIHPILGIPFLQLHPCKSQELLQHTLRSNNRLVSWLSAVAPAALQLKIPQKYFELTISKRRLEINDMFNTLNEPDYDLDEDDDDEDDQDVEDFNN